MQSLTIRWHLILVNRLKLVISETQDAKLIRNTAYIFSKFQRLFNEEITQRIYRPFVSMGILSNSGQQISPSMIKNDGKGKRWRDIVSDNEILLLVRPYLKMGWKRATLTHFGELCKWNLVKSNSLRASHSLPLSFPSGG